MFIFNLVPYPVKCSNELYAWQAQWALQNFAADDVCLLGNARQLILPSLQRHGGWVNNFISTPMEVLDARFLACSKIIAPESIIRPILDEFRSPLDFFIAFVKNGIQVYKYWLSDEIKKLKDRHQIEAIFTCLNDRSLEDVARWHNIPVIHSEGGAIRRPDFRLGTFYFDFSGVNGNTEASDRSRSVGTVFTDFPPMKPQEILEYIATNKTIDLIKNTAEHEFEIGTVLQVEDDSNIICFNNGHTMLDILYQALALFPANKLGLRGHPVSHFKISDNSSLFGLPSRFGIIDQSPSSLAFIKRCKRIFTLNSSVALESLLMGRPTYLFGDSSLRFMTLRNSDRHLMNETAPQKNLAALLDWYVFGYLVPEQYAMNPGYFRWRLGRPSEKEIYDRHRLAWAAECSAERPS